MKRIDVIKANRLTQQLAFLAELEAKGEGSSDAAKATRRALKRRLKACPVCGDSACETKSKDCGK